LLLACRDKDVLGNFRVRIFTGIPRTDYPEGRGAQYPGVMSPNISLICDNSVTTQQRHNSKVSQLKIWDFFQEKILKVLKCYNFLWVQRRHNCSPAASFANHVMTLYLLKVHLQTFLSVPITQKYQILSCDTLVANVRYVDRQYETSFITSFWRLEFW